MTEEYNLRESIREMKFQAETLEIQLNDLIDHPQECDCEEGFSVQDTMFYVFTAFALGLLYKKLL